MKSNLQLCCPNCNKKYTRETAYANHKLLCSNPTIPTTSLPVVNKLQDLSGIIALEAFKSPSVLLQTVEALVKSNNILKMEIAELKKHAQIEKKKIPIMDILNKNFSPLEDYVKALTIEIFKEDLEIIFTYGLIIGIQKILQNHICLIEDDKCPIQAFNQKNNKIYGYNENHKWEQISFEAFDKILLKIRKNIVDEFKKWQDKHETELYSDEFSAIYLDHVKKVMGPNLNQERIHNKIYKNLYDYLKKNLTNIIEYEIT